MITSTPQKQSGYIALITIVLVGSIGLSISIVVLLLSLNSWRSSFAIEQMNNSMALADTCAETALELIRASTSLVGSGTRTLTYGTCTYVITSNGGESRTIDTMGIVGTFRRKVKVGISTINPKIVVSSWQEVGDF